MSQESLSFTLTQINLLVSNLSKKNYAQTVRQLSGVSEILGGFTVVDVLVVVVVVVSRRNIWMIHSEVKYGLKQIMQIHPYPSCWPKNSIVIGS